MAREIDRAAEAIRAVLISPNEADRNLEPANVVDALFFIGRALHSLGEAVEKHVGAEAEQQ
jgi:hypothetical protein